ncbi:MAG: hypothetical protein ACI4UE_01315 [Candidatus Scatovivens sp.]
MFKNKIIKILIIISILLVLFLQNTISYAEMITLKDIVDKFNSSDFVSKMKKEGYEMQASIEENNIKIYYKDKEENEEYSFIYPVLENIISVEIEFKNHIDFMNVNCFLEILDCAEQLHGYKPGEVNETLNSEETKNYTLENEGYEIKQKSDSMISIKFDFTKKIPLIDFSNVYFEVSDIEKDKDSIIDENCSINRTKGNIFFGKVGNKIIIAEKYKLTERSYKSAISILKVMFDNDEIIDYFKNEYNSISIGDKKFDGFDIRINNDLSEFEKKAVSVYLRR